MDWIIATATKFIIGFIIGFIFKDYIKEKLYFLIIIFSKIVGRKNKLSGLWLANFKYPDITSDSKIITYNEVIRLHCAFGYVVGVMVPHKKNGERAKSLSDKKPLRVIGSVKDNTFFTGTWYHPKEDFSYHGAFQLTIMPNNSKIDGRWIGFNTSRNVGSNHWQWEKIES